MWPARYLLPQWELEHLLKEFLSLNNLKYEESGLENINIVTYRFYSQENSSFVVISKSSKYI